MPNVLMREVFEAAARTNVEKHLGDVIEGHETTEEYREEVYCLAFDGAFDTGAGDTASEIATQIADEMSAHWEPVVQA